MELIARLQDQVAPEVFTPRAVYDGRKNLFAPRKLPLGNTDSKVVGRAKRFPIVSEPFIVYLSSRQ